MNRDKWDAINRVRTEGITLLVARLSNGIGVVGKLAGVFLYFLAGGIDGLFGALAGAPEGVVDTGEAIDGKGLEGEQADGDHE